MYFFSIPPSPHTKILGNGRHALILAGARGGAVVKALRYKPEGRGIDSRWCQNFSST
jgi:hypothetical protein